MIMLLLEVMKWPLRLLWGYIVRRDEGSSCWPPLVKEKIECGTCIRLREREGEEGREGGNVIISRE